MFLLLKRRIQKWWSRAPWLTLAVLIGVLYFAGFAMMRWAEPAGNPIRSLTSYTYFFLVTVTTVGYGDVVPTSAAGRLTAGVIAIGGIGAAAAAVGNLFTSIGSFVKRREKGFAEFDMKEHIVIFGNRGAETAALIRQLIADEQSSGTEIVLCSQSTERNPFPDFIDFVRGEPTSNDVMVRACVKDATKIIIHSATDYESICIALAVKEMNQRAVIVVRANDPGKEVDIERVDRNRVVCIKAVDVPMMVREIHNPGITQVLEKLLSPEGQDLRCLQVPQNVPALSFGLLAHDFRERHGAILIGMRPAGSGLNGRAILNPPFNASVEGGMFLDYISSTPIKINWVEMRQAMADQNQS
ncbi:MAG TPA: ion channel [Candidatus Angelobacter sp.]|jgi:voltage-gated potassium channel|nr:ion channel [Candidatus Angelobacter sp.]